MYWAAPLTTGNRELQKLQQEPVYIVVWCDKNLLTTLLQMVQQTISMADQMQTQRESVCASIYIFLWYGKLRQGPTWSYIGVPAGQHSGCRLATMLVATISIVIFFSVFSPRFSSVVYFSHRRSARIKLILWKLTDPIGHFGAPY